jgi:hypothetical protein
VAVYPVGPHFDIGWRTIALHTGEERKGVRPDGRCAIEVGNEEAHEGKPVFGTEAGEGFGTREGEGVFRIGGDERGNLRS